MIRLHTLSYVIDTRKCSLQKLKYMKTFGDSIQVTWSAHDKPMQNYNNFRSLACTAILATHFYFYFFLWDGVPFFFLLPGHISRPNEIKSYVTKPSTLTFNNKRRFKSPTTHHNRSPYNYVTVSPIVLKISMQVVPHNTFRHQKPQLDKTTIFDL